MSSKKRRNWIASAVSAVLGLGCALVLGALFYGAMVHQLAADEPAPAAEPAAAGALALGEGGLESERTWQETAGGAVCTVLSRVYALEEGRTAEAMTAQPAAYLEWLSREGWTPQLITGYVLAGLDATCYRRGDEYLLAARSGDSVYILRAACDEQALYALGAGAGLEETGGPF